MRIEEVFVVGAGFMGNGIAEMAALAGYAVKMSDVSAERLEAGLDEIRSSLGKFRSKDKITEEQCVTALGNLTTTTAIEDAASADLVVEAIPERLELKKEMFGRLDEICGQPAILATNTSAISITSIASATKRPEKVVGTHFFGPVPVMRLCEIIRGMLTSEETFQAADGWARSLGKETVLVRRDHAGFIANRVNIPGSLEAVRLVEAGEAAPAEIDAAAAFGTPGGVGPMQIMDNAGIDVSYNTALAIYEDTGDPRFYPPPLMCRMVAANLLGRKTGRGFYDYSTGEKADYDMGGIVRHPGASDADREKESGGGMIVLRILLPTVLEAVRLIEGGVAVPEDIDKASRLGFNFPLGPLELADAMGLDEILSSARAIYDLTGNGNYFPPALLLRLVESGELGRKSGKGFYDYTSSG